MKKSKESDDKVSASTRRVHQLKASADEGLQQIADRDYRAIFMRRSNQHVHAVLEIGMAFLGKRVAASYRKVKLKTGAAGLPSYI